MVLPFDQVTKSAAETQSLGEKIGYSLLAEKGSGTSRIFCLWGELGSGKTTFTQGLARGLRLPSRLLSPTFIIVRRYDLPKEKRLYHIDLYRVNSGRDVDQLGLSEIFSDPTAYVVVEWAEKLGALLPEKRMDIRFSVLPNGDHRIRISSKDKIPMSNQVQNPNN